jgi:hypothetical protein
LNPGIASSGLFWTTRLDEDNVSHVHPGEGQAVYEAENVRVYDFHDIGNALFGGGPAPVAAVVSFKVKWFGDDTRAQVNNSANGFAANFVRNQAQMEWSATSGGYRYVSAPLHTSQSSFAEIGHERNGTFYRG